MTVFDYVTTAAFLTGLLWLESRLYRWIGSPDDFYVAGRDDNRQHQPFQPRPALTLTASPHQAPRAFANRKHGSDEP